MVGVDITRRMAPKVAFPTTFHPGTSDPAQATIVEIAAGQHVELPSVPVPEARRHVHLTGRVVFDDGSAADGAWVSLRDGSTSRRQVAPGIRVGRDGTFAFDVHAGLSYRVLSHHSPDQPDGKQLSRESDALVISTDTTITVVLPPRK